MKQSEKELLIKELCIRLPYGIKIRTYSSINNFVNDCGDTIDENLTVDVLKRVPINSRPYLRPLSDITNEEIEEFNRVTNNVFKYYPGHAIYNHIPAFDNDCTPFSTGDVEYEYKRVKPENVIACIDFLNSHYFDYRGLIKLGLAIRAPKNMYKIL